MPKLQIVRNTEKLPRSTLVEEILLRRSEPKRQIETMDKLWTDLVTTPWELARSSKAFRLLYGSRIEEAQVDPWYRGHSNIGNGLEWSKIRTTSGPWTTVIAPAELDEVFTITPLVSFQLGSLRNYLDQSDRNEVGRRALVQILALRVWQLEHGGGLPENLAELVTSGLLNVLPTDPYTPKHQFGYVHSSGQPLLPLGRLWPLRPGPEGANEVHRVADSWLLYSVGPDMHDDSARKNDQERDGGDIIFPLAESPKNGSP